MCRKEQWNPRTVKLQPINSAIPTKIMMDDSSYAYLDASDEASIMHSMDCTHGELKERLLQSISVVSSISDDRDGEDKAERRTLISDERHTRITEDTLANRFGISSKMA